MKKRTRPVVVSTRVLPSERHLIGAIAADEGVSVSEAIHRLLMPAVRERLLATSGPSGSRPRTETQQA